MSQSDNQLSTSADQTMDHLNALIGAGRYQEAINCATAANRRRGGDPHLEQQLVRWRWEAFAKRPPRARQVAKRFDGHAHRNPICDVPALELTATTIASALAHYGFLVVRRLATAEDVNRLSAGLDCAFNAFNRAREGAPTADTLPWYAPLRLRRGLLEYQRQWVQRHGSAVLTADSPRVMCQVIELFQQRGVIQTVRDVLLEHPVFSVQKGTLRLMSASTGTPWHQDGKFLGANVRALNVWLALSDCGIDAPGLDFAGRRIPHLVESGTPGAEFTWSVSPAVVETLAQHAPIVTPVFEPGDAVVFDHLTLHRTAVTDRMTMRRKAIESWFFAASSCPPEYDALVI